MMMADYAMAQPTVAIVADRPMAFAAAPGWRFRDDGGRVRADAVADAFGMSQAQLAETLGLAAVTLTKSDRAAAPKTQGRLADMLDILTRVRDWAGGDRHAMAWYRAQPIPALDGRTPEALVKAGRAADVRDWLDHVALGGFA